MSIRTLRHLVIAQLTITTVVLLNFSQATGQPLPDDFTIGNFLEVFNKDSLKIHFNSTGAVVDRTCARYVRVGRMDPLYINVVGQFHDYDMEGNLVFDASIDNNTLHGPAQYFYPNGQIKEEGRYFKDERAGKWTYYYPNGKIQKVLIFTGGEPLVLEYYNPQGEHKVINGDGDFKTLFGVSRENNPFEAWGKLKGGKMDGEWTLYNPDFQQIVSSEIYNEGQFVKGLSRSHGSFEYKDGQKIHLKGFNASENLHIEDYNLGCPGDKGIFYWTYKNKELEESFYKLFLSKISQYKELKNQWLVVGIEITDKDKISTINIASSINDTELEEYAHAEISKLRSWAAAKINFKKITNSIFFTVWILDGTVVIPTELEYLNLAR